MPNYPQALVQFGNVAQVDSATITLSHGITPSMSVLRIAPQDANLEIDSDMILTFGSERIILRDCRADQGTYRLDQSGRLVELTIMDRRWKWRFPTISGHYNVRGADGKIRKIKSLDTEKTDDELAVSDGERTPKELIELCLDAMGEYRRDLNNLPVDLRIEVHWDGENAAQALQQVCDACGVRVVLQLNDTILITNAGNGQTLPVDALEEYSVLLDPPERPEAIIIHFAPSWYQRSIKLKAVGLETDGDIKAIDDLEYKPAGGWSVVDALEMSQIAGESDRDCALQSVFRWFQVLPFQEQDSLATLFFKDSSAEPDMLGYFEYPGSIELLDRQVSQHKVLGTTRHRGAIVFGDWFDETAGSNTTAAYRSLLTSISTYNVNRSILPDSPMIDNVNSLVMFGGDSPVFKRGSSNETLEPILYYRTAVQVRDVKTGEYLHWRYRHVMRAGDGSGSLHVTVPGMRAYFSKVGDVPPDNQTELTKQAQEIAEKYEAAFQIERAEVARYAGWLAISPDGALQSITWHMDIGGATTAIQRNNDNGSATTLPYKLRRINERYALALAATARLDRQRLFPAKDGSFGDASDLPPKTGGIR